MQEIVKYSGCFICGDNNDIGLKARFYFDGDKAYTETVAERRFEGYADIYHGGITSALLDEVMIKALLARDIYVMTVELTVRFRKPVYIGQKLLFEGALEKRQGRLYITTGEVRTGEGEVVATGSGKYIEVKANMKEQLQKSLEE
jgi:acyl-coenzyme A thioesterase PaaI-like protein